MIGYLSSNILSFGGMSEKWKSHLTLLAGLAASILILFYHDLFDMVSIWWNASTYGHCIFIPILIGWLVQQRWPALQQMQPEVWAPGLLWVAIGAVVWLFGSAGSISLFRHAALIIMLQGIVITLLGPAVSRGLAFPIFYAFFMVPFGDEIVPPLQILTAHISMFLLAIVQVPAHLQGIFITTPTGYFEVAEACSGAKFVIAMTAYGFLVCNICFRTWTRRIAFMVFALVLSMLANGFRAFATIYVAHLTSVDSAVGFDHVVYGWLFFAIVMIVVMALAWGFFDRKPGDSLFDPKKLQPVAPANRHAWPIGIGAVVIVGLAPLWLAATSAASPPLPPALNMPEVLNWQRTAIPPMRLWRPQFDGADHFVAGRYVNDAGQVVDLAIVTFDEQEDTRELVGFGQGAATSDNGWTWSSPAYAPANARGEQITAPGPVIRNVVSFYSVGGSSLTGSKPMVKLQTLRGRLTGDDRAVAILVSAENFDGKPADDSIKAFLKDLGDVQRLADDSIGLRN